MDISYPNTGAFPARAEPKAETPLTTVTRDDTTGWWDKFQADIPHINPDDVVSLQCRVIDGKLVHVGALVENGAGAMWLTAPDGFGARPASPESGYPIPSSVVLVDGSSWGRTPNEVQAGKRLPPISGQKSTVKADIYAWDPLPASFQPDHK